MYIYTYIYIYIYIYDPSNYGLWQLLSGRPWQGMGLETKIMKIACDAPGCTAVPRLGYVGIWLRTVKKSFTDRWGQDFSLPISPIFTPLTNTYDTCRDAPKLSQTQVLTISYSWLQPCHLFCSWQCKGLTTWRQLAILLTSWFSQPGFCGQTPLSLHQPWTQENIHTHDNYTQAFAKRWFYMNLPKESGSTLGDPRFAHTHAHTHTHIYIYI